MYLDRIGLTICAIATAKGGAIGIIRVSGFLAFEIAEKLTGISTFEHQKARLAKIKKEGGTADQCLILPFKAPKSFTGEDLVEFQLHGSSGNADEILQMIVKNGANLALRGEFSFRAVMNSKMTLNESIALNTLITSENPFAIELSRKAAFENRSIAKISALLPEWDYLYALSTATMDFPEQISENLDSNKLLDLISRTGADVSSIFKNSQALEKILNYTAVILGRPNVGKSSLFNILINQNRAIVSDIPGTTRDYISETFFIKGFQVNLIDSAGIRISDLEIEKIGIEKSKNLIEKGDLLILLFDGSKALSREDEDLLRETSKKSRILVKNKVDCKNGDFVFSKRQNENLLEISCKTNSGIEVLKDEIYRQILKNVPDKNEALFFTYWQKAKAQKILSDLSNFKLYVYSDQIELIAFFIKNIFFDLKELAGEPTTQEVYDKIFSSFCLGK